MKTGPSGNLVVPVVYLGNAFQSQCVFVEVPGSGVSEEQPLQQDDKLTEEELALLKEYGLEEISEQSDAACEVPAYLSNDCLENAERILAIADPLERQFKLYALFQTSPQLFSALNQELPPEYHLSEEIAFQNLHPIEIPEYDSAGRVTGMLNKHMQLPPQYLKEFPLEIRRQHFDCLSSTGIFGPLQGREAGVAEEDFLGGLFSYERPTVAKVQSGALFPQKRTSVKVTRLSGKNGVPTLFSFVTDEDKALQAQFNKRSGFADRFKDQVKQKFLSLINTKHKQLHAQELIEVLQTIDTRRPNAEQLDIAVTFLYFDKLDIMYSFQLMQQVSNIGIQPLRNHQYGWPTTYPSPNQLEAVSRIAQQTEKRYHELRSKTSHLQELYIKVFQPARRAFESLQPHCPALPRIMERTRAWVSVDGISMIDFRVQEGGLSGIIQVPKALVDEGYLERSALHRQFAEYVQQQMQVLRQQQQRQKRGTRTQQGPGTQIQTIGTTGIPQATPGEEESEAPGKKWRRVSQRRLQLRQRLSERELNQKLLQASRAGSMTLFDLDGFFHLCLLISQYTATGGDVEYPPFYFEDFQARTSFGQQVGFLKAQRWLPGALARFLFWDYSYIQRYLQTARMLKLYRLAAPVGKKALQGCVPLSQIVKEFPEPQPIVLPEETEEDYADLLLPATALQPADFQRLCDGSMSLNEFLRKAVDAADVNGPEVGQEAKQKIESGNEKGVEGNTRPSPQPGYALLSKDEEPFSDAQEDPQAFVYITSLDERPTFSNQTKVDECFYPFYSASQFPNARAFNYAVQVLQAVSLFAAASPRIQEAQARLFVSESFSDYFSSRGGLLEPQGEPRAEVSGYSVLTKALTRAQSLPKDVTLQLIQRIGRPYDCLQTASEAFRLSQEALFALEPSGLQRCLSSMLESSTPNPNLCTVQLNLRAPEAIQEMFSEQSVEKPPFVYPLDQTISAQQQPDVDPAVLKKDSVLAGLRPLGASYKQMPSEMYALLQQQRPELFDIGVYANDPYRQPQSFHETRQLANSVLNRGAYFTIPFGSESSRHVETLETEDYDADQGGAFQGLLDKNKNAQSLVKSQYLKWAGPTGAEAQVCHIEEEQLCFGLFRARANCLLHLLVEWMALYTPGLLKFFDCAVSTTALEASPDYAQMYSYRARIDQEFAEKTRAKLNPYFFNGEYKQAVEDLAAGTGEPPEKESDKEQEEEEEEPEVFRAFSREFDQAVQDQLEIYAHFSRQAQRDELISKVRPIQIEPWVSKGTYAPIQAWPIQGIMGCLPQPPDIPANLQVFLTQIYTTGDVLEAILKNPVTSIPVIARTIQHLAGQARVAEQRAAAVWRLLYPDAYYRSIDHANTCLSFYDKKSLQFKQILQDLSRRQSDLEQAINPQLLDSAPDFCAPKLFDAVNFWRYQRRFQQRPSLRQLTSYHDRLPVYQQFTPESRLLCSFHLTPQQLSQALYGLLNLPPPAPGAKDPASLVWRGLLNNIFQADQMVFGADASRALLDSHQHPPLYDKIASVFPAANWSLLFPSDLLHLYVRDAAEKLCPRPPKDENNTKTFHPTQQQQQEEFVLPDPSQALYMEDLVQDIAGSDRSQPGERELYPDAVELQQTLLEHLRLLRYDNQEAPRFLKARLDEALQQNKPLPSLFQDAALNVPRDTTQIFTRLRTFSTPAVTARSLQLFRSVLFGEATQHDTYSIIHGKVSQTEICRANAGQTQELRDHVFTAIFSNQALSQQKAAAQQQIPALQMEVCRREIFDGFLTPLLVDSIPNKDGAEETQDNGTYRLLDGELYSLLRLMSIACYRLEYCLKVLTELPPQLREAGIYGARARDPLPLSLQNQYNLGQSLFGNNLTEQLEYYQQKPCSKQQQEAIPLQVSQRILNGHQPYANMLNTADPSVNGCPCNCLSCPFCGGIGAGLNGTLSGSINLKVAAQQAVDMDPSLANGAVFMRPNAYAKEDIVFMNMQKDDAETAPKSEHAEHTTSVESAPSMALAERSPAVGFFVLPPTISLLYKLQSCIPQYNLESSIYHPVEETSARQRQRPRSPRDTVTDDDEIDVLTRLQRIKSIGEEGKEFFIPLRGSRLQDTTLLPPAPDSYSHAFYTQAAKKVNNVFQQSYIGASHIDGVLARTNAKVGSPDTFSQQFGAAVYGPQVAQAQQVAEQCAFDATVHSYLLSEELKKAVAPSDLMTFLHRGFVPKQVPSEQEEEDRKRQEAEFFAELLKKLHVNGKDDYLGDQVYALLGTHGYAFLSLKKIVSAVYKKLDQIASKLQSQHFDLIKAQYFKSAKCTVANNLTSSLLVFGLWQNALQNDVASLTPVQFTSSATGLLRDLKENLYLAENYRGFLNLQSIKFDSERRSTK